jgi:molybdopterin molybdotransferase
MAGCTSPLPAYFAAATAHDLPAGGDRAEYVRAKAEGGHISPLMVQDSGLTHTLSQANALLIQQPYAPPRPKGTMVQYMRLL